MEREGTPGDASSLIYLAKANAFSQTRAIIGVILVPPVVWREAVEAGERKREPDPARIRAAHEEGILRRITLGSAAEEAAMELAHRFRLGRGESQVLVATGKGARVLIDDGRAARVAAALEYLPLSTVFLPVLGYRRGILDSAAALELLRRLARVVAIRADVLMRLEAAILEGRR